MQSYSLTVDKFLDHAAKWSGDRAVVEADTGHGARRADYTAVRARANRCSGALLALGLVPGNRVGTLAWNTQHHLELYYAVMGAGMICHTLNPRLAIDHLAAIINEAGDRALAVAVDLLPLWEKLASACPSVEQVIVLDGPAIGRAAADARVSEYETLLARSGRAVVWGGFDENTAAGLCYTSGTTGPPKGVLYTHRSNYLHTLRVLQADAFALTAADVLLVAVPMFHANGWGLPFAAPAAGTKLVLPGRALDGTNLARLIRDEGVTLAVGVQTVWLGLADHLEATGETLPTLQRVLIGGSTCPEALIRRIEDRLGARVQPSWGMTELSPTGTVAPLSGERMAGASGRPPVGVDLKLTDPDGQDLPEQRGVEGRLMVRGSSVIDRYYLSAEDAVDADGWFDTGDLATLDTSGNLTINGRAKDLIKSGGEWINPTEIETVVGRDPAVRHVAVIGRTDAKWGERPVLIVETGGAADPAALVALLRGKVADWWIPSEVAEVTAMPLAASGKIDKARLRADLGEGRIALSRVGR